MVEKCRAVALVFNDTKRSKEMLPIHPLILYRLTKIVLPEEYFIRNLLLLLRAVVFGAYRQN